MNIKRPKLNLTIKFALIISLPILLLSIHISQSYMNTSLWLIEDTMIERAESIARGLALSIEYGLLIENKDILNKSIASYQKEKDILYISIRNISGKELANFGEDQMPNDEEKEIRSISKNPDADEEIVLEGFEGIYEVGETPTLVDLVCDVMTIRETRSREDIGFLEPDILPDPNSQEIIRKMEKIGTVRIGLSKSSMLYYMRKAKLNTYLITLVTVIMISVTTFISVRLMVKPIRHLAIAAERVSQGNFDYPVKTKSKDEIGDLAGSFNRMVSELKLSREALQHRLDMERFVATISTDFINLTSDEIELNINRTLQSIGEILDVDQSYAFLFSNEQDKIQATYEWNVNGVKNIASYFKNRPDEDFSWEKEKIKEFGFLNIPRVSEIPIEANVLKASLQSHGIQSLISVPLIYGGRPIGILGLCSVRTEKVWMEEDITMLKMVAQIIVNALERKRAEEVLQHQLEVEELMSKELEDKTKELTRSNTELNSFVYTVSHDLKAPVVSLQGFSTLLMNNYGDKIDDTGKLYVERIQKNSERMGTLIEDLLELSRIGRINGQRQMVNISDTISEVTNDLGSLLESKRTKLIINGDMPTVYYDRIRLTQIFSNLISNANKFMGNDNNNPIIEIGCDNQDGYHAFYVKDNGIGIDKDYHEKIFQIFQRLDDIETEGSGVGLAIVKKIIESSGGKIWVDSEKGKGTTMYFTMVKSNDLSQISV